MQVDVDESCMCVCICVWELCNSDFLPLRFQATTLPFTWVEEEEGGWEGVPGKEEVETGAEREQA